MTLLLGQGTKPHELPIKTDGFVGPNTVALGHYQITFKDFSEAVLYFLTNSDLEVNDPRLDLVEAVKELKVVQGWDENKSRFNREGV